MASLHTRPIPGRPARLSVEQWQCVLAVLKEGALKASFDTDRWTLRRIRAVILVTFRVRYHAHYLARRLKALGWRAQQPAVYARENEMTAALHASVDVLISSLDSFGMAGSI